MDCFVGASTGALKGVSFKDGHFYNINIIHNLKPECDGITSMCWTSEDQTELLTVQLNRQLKLYDAKNDLLSPLFEVSGGSGSVRGIYMMKNKTVVSATESGSLCLWDQKGKALTELDAGKNLLVMIPDSNDENRCATGGKENPLKIWDLEKGMKTFTAKNVRPDSLQLRVPICDNDIRFLSDARSIVTATGTCQFRLYDPRAQRRPVKEMKWLEEPVTALSLCSSPNLFLAGNTRGDMGLFDIRNKMSMVCKYKGFAGSIRGIAAHSQSPYVASCSIDRFVRLHDLNTKQLLKKVYCKVKLNRILLNDDFSLSDNNAVNKKELIDYENSWKELEASFAFLLELGDEGSSGGSASEEDEALWNDMKGVRDSEKRKHEPATTEYGEDTALKKPKIEEMKRRHTPDVAESVVQVKKRRIKRLKRKWKEPSQENVVIVN
ncbi:unnamed protein product [Enterobius vermicularis]|uniref:WD_REPEATS_REGION domain-containing protein n=1 Tax=Enterobius vermicularis TaxID=51028 RepID=A0A0N4UYC1_ENTVE|nr:unnamed protein product [Enterobius vermicularis]